MTDPYDPEDLNADTSHTRTIRLTGRGKRVLDVGCATGFVSRILTEQFGCTVTGIEANPGAAAKAELRCQRVICGDVETLDFTKELDGERFDVVLFANVLEHLKDPWAVLLKIRDFIDPDGYVVASIPNIGHAAVALELLAGRFAYRPFGLLGKTHLRFFNRRSIYEMFESTGYSIEEISRIEVAPAAAEFQTDLAAFPPEIVDFALRGEEAATFEFIVKACPATAAGSLAALRRRLEQFEASRDERVGRLERGLDAARATLAAREAEVLALRQRLETAETQRETAILELRRLETACTETEAASFALRQRLETAEAEREAAIAERQAHQRVIEDIVSSWSWRVTASARRLKAALSTLAGKIRENSHRVPPV
jgi:2-polyprenyl-3-methyl-5-hydroxy-6-metoxy-1,4-benzoquinol methylase